MFKINVQRGKISFIPLREESIYVFRNPRGVFSRESFLAFCIKYPDYT